MSWLLVAFLGEMHEPCTPLRDPFGGTKLCSDLRNPFNDLKDPFDDLKNPLPSIDPEERMKTSELRIPDELR